MENHIHELIIIGGGPAGLAAGLYAARDGLDCLLLEGMAVGGQILPTTEIVNYPGFTEPVSGAELSGILRKHAEGFGLKMENRLAKAVIKETGSFRIRTDAGDYLSKTVIVATGAAYRKLNVPGEERLQGRGVSYCGSCDGPFFKGKDVIAVGGGDTAIEEALFLTRFARSVKVIHRRDRLRASKYLQEKAFKNDRIAFVWNSVVVEITGADRVEGVVVENVIDGSRGRVDSEAVFVFIGTVPNSDLLKGLVDLDGGGRVITDINMRASVPGVYAAGDVRKDSVRQIASSVGDGVTAAIQVERYLDIIYT